MVLSYIKKEKSEVMAYGNDNDPENTGEAFRIGFG